MRTLTAHQVKEKLEQHPDVQLVMTLGAKAFAKSHIPGSVNLSSLEAARGVLPTDAEIIVYCSDERCRASYQAYRELERAGYLNIWRFAGGLVEWSEAGFPLEGTEEDTLLTEFLVHGNL